MRELTQIRDAVMEALRQAGLTAEAAFPDRAAGKYPGAVATVAVGAAEGKALGFCGYLGELRDGSGRTHELYGKRLTGAVTVELRAERAADCEAGTEAASAALLEGLPEGIRPGELRWEGLAWERTTGMFLRRGQLGCEALFLAQAEEDGGVFLDFQLKGVLKD